MGLDGLGPGQVVLTPDNQNNDFPVIQKHEEDSALKNSIISLSVAAVLTGSLPAFASSVTIPNTFVSGQTAVAADVNANFDALAVGVNDNNSRLTTVETNVGNNTTNISNNTSVINDINGRVTTNEADIADLDTRVTANETAITSLQSGTTCPSDMVAVGSLCVDMYEASVYDAPTGGTIIPDVSTGCAADGSDCGAGSTSPIYARSELGVLPAIKATLYQAAQACANVGKRLPTTTEWQMAASGTPADGTICNSPTGGGTLGTTGALAGCVSSAGAFDMVGNLWEWSADMKDTQAAGGGGPYSTDNMDVLVLGQGFINVGGTVGTNIYYKPNNPLAANSEFGFRCVK